MAAYTIYDVIRHVAQAASWPSEEDRTAAIASITEAEKMGVLGNVARNIECTHEEVNPDGRCAECTRTIEVGHGGARIPQAPYSRQGWRN